jgi:hypothetical protein
MQIRRRCPGVLFATALAVSLFSCGPHAPGDGNEIGIEGTAPERPLDYVRAAPFPRLVLELDHTEGRAPREEVVERLLADLEEILDKPDGIALVHDGILPVRGDDHVWDFAALQALATEHFDLEVAPGTLKIHVLFLDGRYENENVLGVAWGNRTAVVFRDRVESLCQQRLDIVSREAACRHGEHGVLLHEIGHVLGLVNNGLEMHADHEEPDPDRARHCEHDDCVMYWAYARPAAFDLIRDRIGGGVGGGDQDRYATFGPACRADFEAAR